jgi:DNA mismatch repair protein MutL
MSKINILQPNVFNMIAAGEVVERPASVVKELVENSIDAGATVVDVSVADGGIKQITVSDNGIGISSEDLRSAFLPHATSKIKDIADLDGIATLGFRGEALASIASVSEIVMVSKASSGQSAAKIQLSAGKVVSEGEASRAQGTTITVNNLFFNTPARLKFLKKPASEARYIADMLKSLVLANPNVAVSLVSDGDNVLLNEGGSLSDALYSVYDSKTASSLVQVDYISRANIKVSGYCSSVDFTKSNRNYQTSIVNGRVVADSVITAAVEKAYAPYLMKRAFPMFVLDIVVPFNDVDVNVHPSKTEVRFKDKQAVFGTVLHAVENALAKSLSVKTLGFDLSSGEFPNSDAIKTKDALKQQGDFSAADSQNEGYGGSAIDANEKNVELDPKPKDANASDSDGFYGRTSSKIVETRQLSFDTSALYKLKKPLKTTDKRSFYPYERALAQGAPSYTDSGKDNGIFPYTFASDVRESGKAAGRTQDFRIGNGVDGAQDAISAKPAIKAEKPLNGIGSEDKANNLNALDFGKSQAYEEARKKLADMTADYDLADSNGISKEASRSRFFDGAIVGQIFDTYIIIERGDSVYIIDQHAAHERLLYDKIKSHLTPEYTQKLLIPYKHALTAVEADILERELDALEQMGFEISVGNDACTVFSVPSPISEISLNKLFSGLLRQNGADGQISLLDILKDNICQQACKAAIKGGEHLNREQLYCVVKNFVDENGALPQKCPHGRPAVVALSKTEIEKMFKRIV